MIEKSPKLKRPPSSLLLFHVIDVGALTHHNDLIYAFRLIFYLTLGHKVVYQGSLPSLSLKVAVGPLAG